MKVTRNGSQRKALLALSCCYITIMLHFLITKNFPSAEVLAFLKYCSKSYVLEKKYYYNCVYSGSSRNIIIEHKGLTIFENNWFMPV